MNTLQFFIYKGIKLNDVKYGFDDENALTGLERGHEEAAKLLERMVKAYPGNRLRKFREKRQSWGINAICIDYGKLPS